MNFKKYHVSKNLFDISVVQTEGTRNYYLAEDGTETSVYTEGCKCLPQKVMGRKDGHK